MVKGENVNWILYLHQVGFERIFLKAEFPQSFPYLNTASIITYLIDLFKLHNNFLVNSLFKNEVNNLNSNACFMCWLLFFLLIHIKINEIFAMEPPKIILHAIAALRETVSGHEEGRRDTV